MKVPEDRIYLTFGEELRKVVAANPNARQLLEQELKKVLPDARIEPGSLQVIGETPKRDIVLILIAVGITAELVSGAITRVLDAVSRNKHATMKEIHYKPALDGQGKPIYDNGQLIYEISEKPGPAPAGETSNTKVSIPKVVEFELSIGSPKDK
jgi:hypothetical protein